MGEKWKEMGNEVHGGGGLSCDVCARVQHLFGPKFLLFASSSPLSQEETRPRSDIYHIYLSNLPVRAGEILCTRDHDLLGSSNRAALHSVK